jgi:hypothetical protein
MRYGYVVETEGYDLGVSSIAYRGMNLDYAILALKDALSAGLTVALHANPTLEG